MVFTSSISNPDVWFNLSIDKDGNQYYIYILVYVDGIIIVEKEPRKFISFFM